MVRLSVMSAVTGPSSVLGNEACGVEFNRETIPQVDGEEMFYLDI